MMMMVVMMMQEGRLPQRLGMTLVAPKESSLVREMNQVQRENGPRKERKLETKSNLHYKLHFCRLIDLCCVCMYIL